MNRMFAILAAVLVLAGCASTPLTGYPGSPSAVSSTVIAATPSLTPSLIPTVKPSPSPSPTPIVTPEPTILPDMPPFLKKGTVPGMRIGKNEISNSDFIYYADYEEGKDSPIVFRMDRKSGKTKKIRNLPKQSGITSIFLDKSNNLYYSYVLLPPISEEWVFTSFLYKYDPNGDILIDDQFYKTIWIDDKYIYFMSASDNPTKESGIYKYDITQNKTSVILDFSSSFSYESECILHNSPLFFFSTYFDSDPWAAAQERAYCIDVTTGEISEVSSLYLHQTDDGEHIVFIRENNSVEIMNYISLTERTIEIPESDNCSIGLVYKEKLFVVYHGENLKSVVKVFDMTQKKFVAAFTLDTINCTQFYKGKWILYTAVDPYLNGKIMVVDPESYKIMQFAKVEDYAGDLGVEFEIDAGYIWMLHRSDDANYYLWKKIKYS